jgi:hypothetical protein
LAIDGPAYLTQKAEAELAKDQASSAVGTDTAGQPHDDGNGLAIDPNTVPVRPAKAQLTITPSTINVVAKGVGVVPGAIVCADLDAVDPVYGWYSDNWTDPRRGCFHEWSGPADPRRQYSLAGARSTSSTPGLNRSNDETGTQEEPPRTPIRVDLRFGQDCSR